MLSADAICVVRNREERKKLAIWEANTIDRAARVSTIEAHFIDDEFSFVQRVRVIYNKNKLG